jgi:probable phosphoglycerate mutase
MILLLRHGETEWNVERRFQGRGDSPLTARGRSQAEAMARLVGELVARDPHPDWRLLASPLGRTIATAEAVARVIDVPIETDERLMEIHCGAWEGRLASEIADERKMSSRVWIFEAPGGETHEDVHTRITDFLAALPPEPHRRLIVVSHGAAGRVLRGAYLGLDREAMLALDVPQDAVFRLQNGQIDRFDCEPVDS